MDHGYHWLPGLTTHRAMQQTTEKKLRRSRVKIKNVRTSTCSSQLPLFHCPGGALAPRAHTSLKCVRKAVSAASGEGPAWAVNSHSIHAAVHLKATTMIFNPCNDALFALNTHIFPSPKEPQVSPSLWSTDRIIQSPCSCLEETLGQSNHCNSCFQMLQGRASPAKSGNVALFLGGLLWVDCIDSGSAEQSYMTCVSNTQTKQMQCYTLVLLNKQQSC